MTRILFVCHGNICRSPMAEYTLKHYAAQAGCAKQFEIASAATTDEEIGNPVFPSAKCELNKHGIDCAGHHARRITKSDYEKFDLLIGMDNANIRDMRRLFGGDPDGKLHLFMNFTERPGDLPDPWYTYDYEATWRDVDEGCRALLQKLNATTCNKRRTEK